MQKRTGEDSQKCYQACTSLQHALEMLDAPDLIIRKLYSIAHARTGLCTSATFIANIIQSKIGANLIPREMRKLLQDAGNLCEKFDYLK